MTNSTEECRTPLRLGTGKEPPLQASKWLDLPLLIDAEEMHGLFSSLGPFKIFRVGTVCARNEGEVSHEEFLTEYAVYVESLKRGVIPEEKRYRPLFSSIFTLTDDYLFQVVVRDEKRIIRVDKPVLQLQVNQIAYSEADGKFRSMVFGKDSILWGIQFTYPQLFQESESREVFSVLSHPQFLNTVLFRQLQLWVRQNTVPTPFKVGEQKINVPLRLGKQCFNWINSHPQLVNSPIRVQIP